MCFDAFGSLCVVFGPILTPWKPGRSLGSFLEVLRFISTECERVMRLGNPDQILVARRSLAKQ